MNQPKPMYLLAGGRPRDPSLLLFCLTRALLECGKEKPRIAYIGTANQDNETFFANMAELLVSARAGEVELVHLARPDADIDAAKKALEAADAIFLSGGEVEDGMKWLVQHGLTGYIKELYQKGTLLIGISAGSIMLGTHWVRWENPEDDATAELFNCLGFVPTVFDTHGEEEDWKELKVALQLRGSGAKGYGIPRDGMAAADHNGHLINLEKALLPFVNDGGVVRQI